MTEKLGCLKMVMVCLMIAEALGETIIKVVLAIYIFCHMVNFTIKFENIKKTF